MPGAIWMHVSMRGGLLDWLSFRGPSGGTTPRGCSWLLLAAAALWLPLSQGGVILEPLATSCSGLATAFWTRLLLEKTCPGEGEGDFWTWGVLGRSWVVWGTVLGVIFSNFIGENK